MGAVHTVALVPESGDGGFTLIELIAVLVILSIAAAAASLGMARLLDTYLTGQRTADMVYQADFTLKTLTTRFRRTTGVLNVQWVEGTPTIPTVGFNVYIGAAGTSSMTVCRYYMAPPNESRAGVIWKDMFGFIDNPDYQLATGLGDFNSGEAPWAYRFPKNCTDCLPGGPLSKVNGMDLLVVMRNPSGPGPDLRFRTLAALRGNRVPNMPVPN